MECCVPPSSITKRTSRVPNRFPRLTNVLFSHIGFRINSNCCYAFFLSIYLYATDFLLMFIISCGLFNETSLLCPTHRLFKFFMYSNVRCLYSFRVCLAEEAKPRELYLSFAFMLEFSSLFLVFKAVVALALFSIFFSFSMIIVVLVLLVVLVLVLLFKGRNSSWYWPSEQPLLLPSTNEAILFIGRQNTKIFYKDQCPNKLP